MRNAFGRRLGATAIALVGMLWLLPRPSYAVTFPPTNLEIYQEFGTLNAFTGCNGDNMSGNIAVVPTVSLEGITEKSSDPVVETEPSGGFIKNHTITLTFTAGADLTSPVVANGGTLPSANVVVCNSTLAITQPVVTRALTINGVQVSISFTVTTTDTGFEAAVALRNLRWDVHNLLNFSNLAFSGTDCDNSSPPICSGLPTPSGGDGEAGAGNVLAHVQQTINSSFVNPIGFGLQNSNAGLLTQAEFGFAEQFRGALRAAQAASAAISDIATTPTSVEFAISNPIAGVSIAMPSQFLVDPLDNALLLGSSSGTCSGTATNIDCTYQTINSDTDNDDMAFTTANGTQMQTGAAAGSNTIVVTIGSSSGSGFADLDLTFGPDANGSPAAIPRYMHPSGCTFSPDLACGGSSSEGRGIIHNLLFEVFPAKTDILVPWVTNLFGFNAGIAVSNTGLDTFGSFFCPSPPCAVSSQATGFSSTGPVTVTIFPDDGTAPIVFTTGPGKTPGRGLAANGTLAPGATWAVDLTGLLAAAGVVTPKEGYMLIQTGFTLGHAAVFDFTPSFGFADTPVIVLPDNICRGSATPGIKIICNPFVFNEPQGQIAGRKPGGSN